MVRMFDDDDDDDMLSHSTRSTNVTDRQTDGQN